MAEAMPDDRLAVIRSAAKQYQGTSTIRRRPGSAIAHRAELLAEVDRLRARTAEPIGIMRVPLEKRTDAIRDQYLAFAFSGPTDIDRERDQVIGYLLSELGSRDDELDRLRTQHQPGPVLRAWRSDASGRHVHGDAAWVQQQVAKYGAAHLVADTCSHVGPWRQPRPGEEGDDDG